jgi:hypothetical protein
LAAEEGVKFILPMRPESPFTFVRPLPIDSYALDSSGRSLQLVKKNDNNMEVLDHQGWLGPEYTHIIDGVLRFRALTSPWAGFPP